VSFDLSRATYPAMEFWSLADPVEGPVSYSQLVSP
jgi:hypothetical protein